MSKFSRVLERWDSLRQKKGFWVVSGAIIVGLIGMAIFAIARKMLSLFLLSFILLVLMVIILFGPAGIMILIMMLGALIVAAPPPPNPVFEPLEVYRDLSQVAVPYREVNILQAESTYLERSNDRTTLEESVNKLYLAYLPLSVAEGDEGQVRIEFLDFFKQVIAATVHALTNPNQVGSSLADYFVQIIVIGGTIELIREIARRARKKGKKTPPEDSTSAPSELHIHIHQYNVYPPPAEGRGPGQDEGDMKSMLWSALADDIDKLAVFFSTSPPAHVEEIAHQTGLEMNKLGYLLNLLPFNHDADCFWSPVS